MKHALIALFLCCHALLHAQTGTVSGKCTDKKGRSLEHVVVVVPALNNYKTETDKDGAYTLILPADTLYDVYFQFEVLREKRQFKVAKNEQLKAPTLVFQIIDINVLQVEVDGIEGGIRNLPKLDWQNLPVNGVERTLVYTTAASSNNELTSNYNVRGGNYDENLVYVNDFLINRPFLTRSGQQEGLSFINSALVQDVRFSGGGFESKYGDKLSSVLDITYKTPDSLNASVMASLLGVESHVAHKVTHRFNYLAGARYRANGYLLNSLPTKGAYNPVFYDAQVLLNYYIRDNVMWSTIIHASNNDYRFSPQTQETDFGTVNEAYRLKIYFDGQEQTKFQTLTAGTAIKWAVNKRTQLDFYASVFRSNEQEYFDVQGQYFINLLETDPSKEAFGDSIATLGVGTFLNHARNRLVADIINVYHNGAYRINANNSLNWGVNFQHDNFTDVLSEWKMVDSAGFSLPDNNNDNALDLFSVIKGRLNLEANRYTGFFQWNSGKRNVKRNYAVQVTERRPGHDDVPRKRIIHRDTIDQSVSRWELVLGVRSGYTEVNQEFWVTPRVSFAFYPRRYYFNDGKIRKRNAAFKLASGLYYQPPFYREFRTFDGKLNTQVKAQKSFHIVSAYDFLFSMWGRQKPFKFSVEGYYKYLWDVNPYEVDNVRTRYYAQNMATAYAYGLDVNLHGEFVEGVESFFKVGFLSTKEDIKDDVYTLYYNAAGERIYFGVSEDQTPVDSAVVHPKGIPRPTDQFMNFAILFQDNMPGFERFTVQLALNFGSRLPYGPPDYQRYKDTLRQKSYFRTDIGLSYDLLNKKGKVKSARKRRFSDAVVSFEVFNLMGINNVLSKQWLQDVNGRYYAIPNYLTQRRYNLKLILRI